MRTKTPGDGKKINRGWLAGKLLCCGTHAKSKIFITDEDVAAVLRRGGWLWFRLESLSSALEHWPRSSENNTPVL